MEPKQLNPSTWFWLTQVGDGPRMNSYYLTEQVGKTGLESIIIDPAGDPSDFEDQLLTEAVPTSILVTSSHHDRRVKDYSDHFHLDVWAPAGAVDTLAAEGVTVDHSYTGGEELMGGLEVLGLGEDQAVLYKPGEYLVTPDLLVPSGDGIQFLFQVLGREVPGAHKQLVERLAELEFDMLLPGHGQPLTSGAQEQVKQLAGQD